MSWIDNLINNDPAQGQQGALSDDDKQKLQRQGLLQAGLSILGNTRRAGVSPFAALSGGILSGIGTIQDGASQLQHDRFQQQVQADQINTIQRRRAMQDLATKFAKPDGSFDMAGYQQAAFQLDPETALEFQKNQAQAQQAQQQVQMNTRALAQPVAPNVRNVLQGSQEMQQEQQPDGTWKTIGQGSRFAPQQAHDKYQFITGADGKTYRANPQTGDLQPVLGPDGSAFAAQPKPGQGGALGGGRASAAQIKAYDNRDKMLQEANNGSDAAYQAASQLTNTPVAQLKQMSPADLEAFINKNGDSTGYGASLVHPSDYIQLETLNKQAALSNAVINSLGNKPTDTDVKINQGATFRNHIPLAQNAQLIRQQIEKGQKTVNDINTLVTQFANGGSLPNGVTQGGTGSANIPPAVSLGAQGGLSPVDAALLKYGH